MLGTHQGLRKTLSVGQGQLMDYLLGAICAFLLFLYLLYALLRPERF
ncbi:MAG: K(+)-transporting ATPase subunit F [Bryobacterales bacterium]|nr:K(+)-transporting ATPase subunit F [Bryobacterales bacterium]